MAVKDPGVSGGRRVNRYAVAGGNHADIRHKLVDGTTIAFVSPDQITDSGSGLAVFSVGELVSVQGSVAQNSVFEIATVVAGQLDMVEQTITAEGAGAQIALNSENNKIGGLFS